MNTLPIQRASQLPSASVHQWLIEELWSDQAVGMLGGEPKCCKSLLALELAVSVASGAPCLRRFAVHRPGPVLLFPAEDSLPVVRARLEWICAIAQVSFETLPVEVITAHVVRLDLPPDRQCLTETVQALRPRLLILDPMIHSRHFFFPSSATSASPRDSPTNPTGHPSASEYSPPIGPAALPSPTRSTRPS